MGKILPQCISYVPTGIRPCSLLNNTLFYSFVFAYVNFIESVPLQSEDKSDISYEETMKRQTKHTHNVGQYHGNEYKSDGKF